MATTGQIEKICTALLQRLGPACPIGLIGAEPALPSEKTIRNLRSLKQIPEDCFFKDGMKRVLVDTEKFLAWWSSRCSKT